MVERSLAFFQGQATWSKLPCLGAPTAYRLKIGANCWVSPECSQDADPVLIVRSQRPCASCVLARWWRPGMHGRHAGFGRHRHGQCERGKSVITPPKKSAWAGCAVMLLQYLQGAPFRRCADNSLRVQNSAACNEYVCGASEDIDMGLGAKAMKSSSKGPYYSPIHKGTTSI